MIVTKKSLPRRTFLRGIGVTLSLPVLDAMVPALSAVTAAAANPVRRLGFVYIPMGMNPAPWIPRARHERSRRHRTSRSSASAASIAPETA